MSHQARIRLTVPSGGRVQATVYNVAGRRLRSLLDRELASGLHDLTWDGRDDAGRLLPGGVCFATIVTPQAVSSAKVALIR